MIAALSLLLIFLLVPAAAVTAVLAIVFASSQIGRSAPMRRSVLVGTFVPSLMLVLGLYGAWPWPWAQPETLHDGFGADGSMFVIYAAPIWVGCLLVSLSVFKLLANRNGS